jgi:hypothetical protein
VAGKDFTAVDFNVAVVSKVNELAMPELGENLISRHFAQFPQMGNRVFAWMSLACDVVDLDVHQLLVADKVFAAVDMHLAILVERVKFAVNLLAKNVIMRNFGKMLQMLHTVWPLVDLKVLSVDFDFNFVVVVFMFMPVVLFSRALLRLWRVFMVFHNVKTPPSPHRFGRFIGR